MAVTNEQINQWLSQNPNASDAQIRSAMDQYGVTTGMLSQATGMDQNTVQARYDAATPTQQQGGITVAGQYYSPQQIKDFYAQGGNDVRFAQEAGMTDLGAIHDLAVKARGIGGAPTGDAATQRYFQQYQQYNPGGANVNNYAGWLADQNPNTLNAMRAGVYTGSAVSPTDYTPGGIYGPGSAAYGKPGYASGLGPRGDGGTWGTSATIGQSGGSSGATPPQVPPQYKPPTPMRAGGGNPVGYAPQRQSMYPYQNYGRQGMFGGTASSRMPYTGYQAYQPYGGYGRNTGMFGAPTMNYNMRNRPMQQINPYSQMGWSQNNPWSFQ